MAAIFQADKEARRRDLQTRFPDYAIDEAYLNMFVRTKYSNAKRFHADPSALMGGREVISRADWFKRSYGEDLLAYIRRCQVALKAHGKVAA